MKTSQDVANERKKEISAAIFRLKHQTNLFKLGFLNKKKSKSNSSSDK